MSERTCEGCRWFLQHQSQSIGQCRRYPPTQNTEAGWLYVRAFDWCGEWADKTITPEQAERRELVQQFAVAIVQGMCASNSSIGYTEFPAFAWRRAEQIADAEGQV